MGPRPGWAHMHIKLDVGEPGRTASAVAAHQLRERFQRVLAVLACPMCMDPSSSNGHARRGRHARGAMALQEPFHA